MAYKIDISDLALNQLNAACLNKISKFSVALEQLDGRILELKSNHVMRELVGIAKSTDDIILQTLYRSIKQEIKIHINSSKFIKQHSKASNHEMRTSSFEVSSQGKRK